MKIIRDKKFNKGEIVPVDNCYFINCTSEPCIFLFGGGDFGWQGCFFHASRFRFVGPAQNTLNFLAHFGYKPQPVEKPIILPKEVN